ncbi:leucyl aminopeptidase [Desulfatitalea alkaliphila]|uniref:Probable cytosol aminopeptidase n=1 Tax=Desulfatitalea alkaliphila TaxID=2929485 RepID=A0AA41UMN6_9BACT|nr:leucyl aminopeptidase [Desulfatitalea alkaliphila]MCJ8502816.1 leucyl aminopeptidase [Desulfatitalea alkaliphila]
MLDFLTTSPGHAKFKTADLAVPVCENAEIHDDPGIRELAAKALAIDGFKGEKQQQVVLFDLLGGKVRRCWFMGLGPVEKIDAETLRVFAGRAVREAAAAKRQGTALAVPLAAALPVVPAAKVQALAEGAYLGNHQFNKYKEKPKTQPLETLQLLVPPATAKKHRPLLQRTEAVCHGTTLAREWVSTPANDKLPSDLAQIFAATARAAQLKVRVLDEQQLKRQKFNTLLAVAAGSDNPPRLVEMTYAPPKADKTIVLVGKGITFDTGGVNIKPSAGLDTMKGDMAGAAAVTGAMAAMATLKPKHRIIGLTPLVENMVSGRATRPGDIVTTYAGKTVEIGNTDAEGRLILADTLAYAIKKHKPDMLIDLATLTGACVVALGEKLAGLFSPDDTLAETILAAGRATHERCWRLPLPEDYKELMKSDLADLNNMSSSRYGGAITAALFLSEFTGDTPWAHIDIAGPAFQKKSTDYCGPGGTGFGVRLLCHLVEVC